MRASTLIFRSELFVKVTSVIAAYLGKKIGVAKKENDDLHSDKESTAARMDLGKRLNGKLV